jgi:hypothetical protein
VWKQGRLNIISILQTVFRPGFTKIYASPRARAGGHHKRRAHINLWPRLVCLGTILLFVSGCGVFFLKDEDARYETYREEFAPYEKLNTVEGYKELLLSTPKTR